MGHIGSLSIRHEKKVGDIALTRAPKDVTAHFNAAARAKPLTTRAPKGPRQRETVLKSDEERLLLPGAPLTQLV